MMYWKNMGRAEQWIRALGGVAMVAAGFVLFGGETRSWVWAASGVGLALSGAVGFCPACYLFGRRGAGPGR